MALKSIDLPLRPRSPATRFLQSLSRLTLRAPHRVSLDQRQDPDTGRRVEAKIRESSCFPRTWFEGQLVKSVLEGIESGNELFRQVGRSNRSKLSTSRRRNEPIGHHCRFDSVIKVFSRQPAILSANFSFFFFFLLSNPARKGRTRRGRHNKTINSDSCEAEQSSSTQWSSQDRPPPPFRIIYSISGGHPPPLFFSFLSSLISAYCLDPRLPVHNCRHTCLSKRQIAQIMFPLSPFVSLEHSKNSPSWPPRVSIL